jgi:hypothetical protein
VPHKNSHNWTREFRVFIYSAVTSVPGWQRIFFVRQPRQPTSVTEVQLILKAMITVRAVNTLDSASPDGEPSGNMMDRIVWIFIVCRRS